MCDRLANHADNRGRGLPVGINSRGRLALEELQQCHRRVYVAQLLHARLSFLVRLHASSDGGGGGGACSRMRGLQMAQVRKCT